MKRYLLVVLCSLLFHYAGAEKREVHILAVNDMHAAIEVFPQFAALVDSLRAVDPGLLLFSAGDNCTGNPLSDKYEIPSYPIVALMNQVGFSGSVLGNHDFDNHSLKRLVGLSNFRYICANMWAHDSTGVSVVPCQVFDAGGVKVGVVGAIQLSPHGFPSTHPDNLQGLVFAPAIESIPQYEWLRKECDAVVLLSHLGHDDDIEMAKMFPWLDLIIGGHTHTQLLGNERVNDVLITQNRNRLRRAAYITLTVDSGRVVDKRAEYFDIKNYPKKNKLIASMVKFFSDNPMLQRVVAQAEAAFGDKEEIGSMICDAFLDAFDADIALQNAGGVRIDRLAAGDITVRKVLEMDPFDNNAVILELTGEELLLMLTSYASGRTRSFPYVSGMRCELTVYKTNRERIKGVRLLTKEGKKLDMKRRYRIVTNNYVVATSKVPEGAARAQNVQTADLITRFLEKQKKVNYQGVRRLTYKESK